MCLFHVLLCNMYSNISVFYSIFSADFLQVSKFYFKCLIIHELFLLIVIPPLHLIHICIFLSCVLYTGSQYSSFYCIFFYFFFLFSLTLSSSFTPYCVVFVCILYFFFNFTYIFRLSPDICQLFYPIYCGWFYSTLLVFS